MAAAFSHFTKHQKGAPDDIDPLQRVRDEFLHVTYKINKGFQEAFDCKFNDKEKKEWFEYKRQHAMAAANERNDEE
jgi:hypothetical protein